MGFATPYGPPLPKLLPGEGRGTEAINAGATDPLAIVRAGNVR